MKKAIKACATRLLVVLVPEAAIGRVLFRASYMSHMALRLMTEERMDSKQKRCEPVGRQRQRVEGCSSRKQLFER